MHSGGGSSGYSHGGDIAGGGELTGPVVELARGWVRLRGERGKTQVLTAVRLKRTASPGAARRRRIVDGGHRTQRRGTTVLRVRESSWRRVT